MWRGLERCLGQHEKEKQLLLSTDMNPRGLFFFIICGACLPLHLREWSVWLRGLTKLRESQMSEKIISVCESSSDFPQIPFHSGEE